MRGDLGRVAFIWPSDGLNDDEFLAYLPDDVAWLVNRFPGTLDGHSLDMDTFRFSAELQPMVNAAHMMSSVIPDIVALGDHAGSFISGIAHEREQRKALMDACGATFATTVSIALSRAIVHHGLQRVCVSSPYPQDVTEKGVQFLQQQSIEIVASESLALPDEHAINAMTLADWLKALMRIDRPDADAIVIFGGGLRLAQWLNRLENSIGKPVIPATAALVWDVCRLLGIASLQRCAGSLVSTLDQPALASAQSRVATHPISTGLLAPRLSTATKIFALSDTPPTFVSAQGSSLVDQSGRQFLDFACGSGTTALGHAHPAVTQAVREQLATGILHVGPHFHTTAQLALIDRLTNELPDTLNVIHPATNGTEATEAAIKAAIHATGKHCFISFEGSYHGRTLGALALSHARGSNTTLGALYPDVLFLPYPMALSVTETPSEKSTHQSLNDFEQQLDHHLATADIAGVIIETVQATAGMRQAGPQYLHILRRLTQRYQVPLIFDEVFTGFGRTGSLFHFEQLDITPDMLILGKAVGGGIPGALLAGSDTILRHWSPGTQSSTFQMHPLAAATSLATLDELRRLAPRGRVQAIGQRLCNAIRSHISVYPHVAALRGIGAMWGLEIVDADGRADQLQARCIRQLALEQGLITWECGLDGHVIGLVPPLTVSDEDIDRAICILLQTIKQTGAQGTVAMD